MEIAQFHELNIASRTVAKIIATSKIEASQLRLKIGAGAGIQLILPELSADFGLTVEVGAQAQVTVSVPAAIKKNSQADFKILLVGEGANVHAQFGLMAYGEADSKIYCLLEHTAPRTLGRITARRVLYDAAHVAFKGMLKVGAGANGTDTYLSDKVVLMGEKTQAMSDPQLEILADDVKASHGATIGRLSQAELFYLRSRGLTENRAEVMLVQAFLSPALIGVPLEIVENLLNNEVSNRPSA